MKCCSVFIYIISRSVYIFVDCIVFVLVALGSR